MSAIATPAPEMNRRHSKRVTPAVSEGESADMSGQEGDRVSVDELAAAVAVIGIQLTQDDAARLFAVQVRGHLLFDHTKGE